jgi:hypothetical protein
MRVTYLHGGWAWSITTFKVFRLGESERHSTNQTDILSCLMHDQAYYNVLDSLKLQRPELLMSALCSFSRDIPGLEGKRS